MKININGIFSLLCFINLIFCTILNQEEMFKYDEKSIENFLSPKPQILIKGEKEFFLDENIKINFILSDKSNSYKNTDSYQDSIYEYIINLYDKIIHNNYNSYENSVNKGKEHFLNSFSQRSN